MESQELQALREATTGLLYPSESDEPILVKQWKASDEAIASVLAAHVQAGKQAKIEQRSLEQFFRELEASEDVRDFQRVKEVLQRHLFDLRVLRIGSVRVQVFVIGKRAPGDWIGLHTVSVETG